MAKPALGRGLGALLGGGTSTKSAPPSSNSVEGRIAHGMTGLTSAGSDTRGAAKNARPADETASAPNADAVRRVPLDSVVPCPLQPRKDFAPEALQELAESIKAQGIVQPLIVRERNGKFELIAGERRWRAARTAQLREVPIIVREADDATVLELALIENLQRENLNALEEALGYSQLSEQFKLTQEEIAVKVGKSRASVANALRLLRLPAELQDHVRKGRLSVGHAKALLGLEEAVAQRALAERILKSGLNVRQAEALAAEKPGKAPIPTDKPKSQTADLHVASLEDKLRQRLGTKIHLKYHAGRGSVEIAFFSDDELDRILGILGVESD